MELETNVTVAAVIPTMGRPELRRAVVSVLEQTMDTEPIVVVADPDRYDEVRRHLGDLMGSVKVVDAGRALNGSQARNRGVDAADTTYVGFLDDDDWWHPRKSEIQVRTLESVAVEMVASSDTLFGRPVDAPGTVRWETSRRTPQVRHTQGPLADYLLARPRLRYGRHFLQTSSIVGRTSTFRAHRWDETLPKHQDWDLLIRLVDIHGVGHVAVPKLLTYVHQGSVASVSRRPDWRTTLNWLESVRVSPRSRNDFVLATVIRPCLQVRDHDGVRAGLDALTWSRPPRTAAALGVLAGVRRSDPQVMGAL
jgi:glycosyltransferase involved in cell wall biosynthesis